MRKGLGLIVGLVLMVVADTRGEERPDLSDPEVLQKILGKAILRATLEERGPEGEELFYVVEPMKTGPVFMGSTNPHNPERDWFFPDHTKPQAPDHTVPNLLQKGIRLQQLFDNLDDSITPGIVAKGQRLILTPVPE